jgi:hypothetical protein
MSIPTITHCPECQSKSLSWQTHNKIASGVQQGRLNSNDIQCQLVLGCNSCSETLSIISADMVAAWLTENGPSTMDHATLPAAATDSMEKMAFVYVHPQAGERHTVTVSRNEVAEYMEEELFSKLCECFCSCESVGETNVVECRCNEVAEQFELVKP